MGFPQTQRTPPGRQWTQNPQWCSHPRCLVRCWTGELSGSVSKAQNTGAASVTGRQGRGHPPPRWRWHPLPQSLHTLSYLEERFPIYGLQSRHTTLPLLLGREDRRPCHQFYTANCCSVYISTMEIRERLAKKQLNRRSTSLLTKSVYGVPSSKYSHLSIFLLNPRLKRLIRFIDNI